MQTDIFSIFFHLPENIKSKVLIPRKYSTVDQSFWSTVDSDAVYF